MAKKKYYDELNVFRALVIVWVVIGHSFDNEGVLGFLHNYAYSFHMCAFFMLSGLLFSSKIGKINSFADAANTVWIKFKRLMVPYFVCTLISYVLKLLFDDFAYNKVSSNIVVDTLLGINNPNGGIWFLYMLFVLSVIAVILCKVPWWINLILSVVLKVIITVNYFSVPVLSTVCFYLIYFYIGIALFRCYSSVNSRIFSLISKKSGKLGVCILSAALLICSFLIVYFQSDIPAYTYISIFVTFYMIFTWYVVSLAVCALNPLKKIAMVIGNYGMDIYIIGYYVQIGIRVVLGSMLGAPYYLYSSLMFVFGLLLPIPVSKYIVRKVGLFKAMFLGEFPKKEKTKTPNDKK